MSKGLEELQRLAYENACCRCQYFIDKKCTNKGECVWKTIEKELKEREQYKAIEEEIGISLVTLFKALDEKQRIFVLNEYDMRVVELPVRYASRKLVDGEIFINAGGCFANFKIKDYGKWWALTKEELL